MRKIRWTVSFDTMIDEDGLTDWEFDAALDGHAEPFEKAIEQAVESSGFADQPLELEGIVRVTTDWPN